MVLDDQRLFRELFEGMIDDDPIVRARSADAVEKVTRIHPEYVQPFKKQVLTETTTVSQQEVRWHIAQMLPRLNLTRRERANVVRLLFSWIDAPEKSRIVRVSALQSLADFADQDPTIRTKVSHKLRNVLKNGSPAMKSRSRKLIEQLAARDR